MIEMRGERFGTSIGCDRPKAWRDWAIVMSRSVPMQIACRNLHPTGYNSDPQRGRTLAPVSARPRGDGVTQATLSVPAASRLPLGLTGNRSRGDGPNTTQQMRPNARLPG